MRQPNRKAPLIFRVGLMLLCAMLVTTNMMGGLYARYSTTVIGSATARVAKFDREVNYRTNGYGGDEMNLNQDIYAVIEEFQVLNSGEVSLKYDMKIKLSLYRADATFMDGKAAPLYCTIAVPAEYDASKLYHIRHKNLETTDGEIAQVSWSDILNSKLHTSEETNDTGSITGFEANKIYYAVSEDGKNYTWKSIENNSDDVLSLNGKLGFSEAHYYKVLYFIDLRNEDGFEMEDIELSLVYQMDCEQID